MRTLAAKLLTATALAAGALAASPALAVEVVPEFDFKVFEFTDAFGSACSPFSEECGHFQIFNFTDPSEQISITGFRVGNPDATHAETERPGWSAEILASVDFPGAATQPAFNYLGSAPANYIDGGESSDRFFWFAGTPASPYIIDYIGPTGQTGSCSAVDVGDSFGCNAVFVAAVPEPMTAALIGTGLLALAAGRRRAA
jgi:hypothetical protein